MSRNNRILLHKNGCAESLSGKVRDELPACEAPGTPADALTGQGRVHHTGRRVARPIFVRRT